MKKLLSILGAAGLVVSTSAVLVSCGTKDAGDKDDVVQKALNAAKTAIDEEINSQNFKDEAAAKAAINKILEDVKFTPTELKADSVKITIKADEPTRDGNVTPETEDKEITLVATTTKEKVETPAPDALNAREGEGEGEETPNLDALALEIARIGAIEKGTKTDEAYAELKAAIKVATNVKDETKAEAALTALKAAEKAFKDSKDVEEGKPDPEPTPGKEYVWNEAPEANKEIKVTVKVEKTATPEEAAFFYQA